jgi:hypothetical protein
MIRKPELQIENSGFQPAGRSGRDPYENLTEIGEGRTFFLWITFAKKSSL